MLDHNTSADNQPVHFWHVVKGHVVAGDEALQLALKLDLVFNPSTFCEKKKATILNTIYSILLIKSKKTL